MIAVIKGDIVASRKIENPDMWMTPLKNYFSEWGTMPKSWDITWGDSFQVEISRPQEALSAALTIKAIVKRIGSTNPKRHLGIGDVRMTIGIGEKTYSGERIFESNGTAFIHAGEKFEELEKNRLSLLLKSPWRDFDEDMNLYLRLLSLFMDKWSIASAELVEMVLRNPLMKQHEIGAKIGIGQNSVSGRWKRANIDELLAVDTMYRQKLENRLK